MTIQDWGAVGEIVGAFGIVVTLLYLATQIRYARIASTDASRQHRVAAIREIETQVLNNPEIFEAWSKATGSTFSEMMQQPLMEAYNLNSREAQLVEKVASVWLWTHWAQHRSMKSDTDIEELETLVSNFYSARPMDLFISLPYVRAHFDHDFWSWMDRVLEASDKN